PKFSPDGQKLAYRSYAFPNMLLHVTDLRGTTSERIDSPNWHPVVSGTAFLWSPDGRGILTPAADGASFGSYVFPIDGSAPIRVDESQRQIIGRYQPTAWIGDRLFGNFREGFRSSLAEVGLSARSWKRGRGFTRITQGTGSESGAAPSADGSKIAFA